MEGTAMLGLYEALSDVGKMEVLDFTNAVLEREQKERSRRDFLAKLKRSDEQIRTGRVVIKTMEELEAMAQ